MVAEAGVLYAHAPAWALDQVVALRVSLDDSLHTNGPLRVLPNTHQLGVLSDDGIGRLARKTPAVDCIASSKSGDDRPRRVLHLEYASAASLAPHIDLAVV